jgi:glycosyltransferase involved in cell wall biosynthesis
MGTVPLDRPLPIAIVLPSFQPGGTERQMTELVCRLDDRRWEIHLACCRREGAWFSRAAEAAASVADFPVASFRDGRVVGQMRRFARWCHERRIAVVHTSELYSNIMFLPAAALARVPVRIGSRREINAGKSAGQIALQRAAYTCAHRIVANADAVAARLRRECVPAEKIAVIPNGLDLNRFVPRLLPDRLRRVVMVANLRPEKGHDALIAAAVDVLRQFPDARFELIGDGTERARFERLVQERGMAGVISFAGHCENVPERLAAADIFVLPSESEAFPNAVLEAMAAGLPVIASAVGGIAEVVQDGRTGLLVPPRNAAALSRQICRLMSDRALGGSLAAAGRSLVEARYSFDRMVAAIDRLYDDEIAHRAPNLTVQSQFASL